jgi:hypothetical protein
MPICKLCLQDKPLIKSHIIPDFYYKIAGLYNNRHEVLTSTFDDIAVGNRPRKQNSGEYEVGLLCAHCDGIIIGGYETYAAKAFNGEAGTEMADFILPDHSKCRRYYNLDYRNYKLFLLSILWRMSISNRPIFQNMDLGAEHNEILRQMILTGDPREIYNYPILSSHYFNDTTIVEPYILSPIQYNDGRTTKVISVLPGFIHIFIISNSDSLYNLDELQNQCINKKNEVTFMELEDGMTMALFKKIGGDFHRANQ